MLIESDDLFLVNKDGVSYRVEAAALFRLLTGGNGGNSSTIETPVINNP